MKLKIPLYTLLYLGISVTTQAQKLPNIQENSLRAPVDIRIDGKASEWGNKFQAYNHATDIFYTLANDDDNLYLVVQVADPNIISRITSRGITFSIQHGASKEDKNQANITYPVSKTPPYFGLNRKKYELIDTSIKAADSVMRRYNKMIDDSCKFIGINGIAGIDTLISVYNRDGIKARGQFNNKKVFTCELSIKLKLINASVNDNANLTYKISINGYKTAPITISPPSNPTPDQQAAFERQQQLINKLIAPTYLQGEYKLIKKLN
jgi:hypothetical protein